MCQPIKKGVHKEVQKDVENFPSICEATQGEILSVHGKLTNWLV